MDGRKEEFVDQLKALFRCLRRRSASRPSSRTSHRDALVDEATGIETQGRLARSLSPQPDTAPSHDAVIDQTSPVDIAGDNDPTQDAKETLCAGNAVRYESLWEVAYREILRNDADGKKTALITSLGFSLSSINFDTLEQNLNAIKTNINEVRAVKAEKSFTIPGGPTLRLGEINRRILEWIDRFKQIGDIIIQYGPGHAALPWACFRFMLQTYINYKQTMDDILVIIERCSYIAIWGELVEQFYLRGSASAPGLDPANNTFGPLRENLQELYEATLDCIFEVAGRSSANFPSKVMSAILSEPELRQYLNTLERKLRNVSDLESLAASAVSQSRASEQANTLKNLLENINAYHDAMKAIGGDVQAILANQKTNNEETKRNAEAAQQKEHLAKLRAKVAEGAGFDSRIMEHKPRCLQDTRVELLERISKWARDTSGDKCIYWLRGMAGTGKSTIARTVACRLSEEGRLGASFFFSKGQGDCSNASLFATTIAASLVSSLPDLEPYVARAIGQHSEIFGKTLRQQWEKLILQPLENLCSAPPEKLPVIFVVDALDECEGDDDARLILELFSQIGSISGPTKLRVFVTSRPERHIGFSFDSLPQNMHDCFNLYDIPEKIVDNDIETFLRHEMAQIRKRHRLSSEWPGEESIQSICTAACQLFIYASTACRLIERVRDKTRALTIILNNNRELDQLYNAVLEHAIADGDELELATYEEELSRESEDFNLIVGSIVTLLSPLPVLPLARLVGVGEGTLRSTVDALGSILEVSEDDSNAGSIRLLHPSFRDFLLDPKRCQVRFRVDERQAHTNLLLHCLKLMSESLREDICELKAPGCTADAVDKDRLKKFLHADVRYACRYWVEHLQRGNFTPHDNDQVHEFLRIHFLHWLEALSLMGILPEGINAMKVLGSKISPGSNGLLQRLVHDAGRFIMKHRAIIEGAPLQVYISALIFSPSESVIRQHFSAAVPEWIERPPIAQNVWDPSVQTLEGHSYRVNTLAFSPDGKLLASGSWDDTVRLWDAATGASRGSLEGHSDGVNTLAFSPDGKLLASGSEDHTVRLWDAATGASRGSLKGHSSSVYALAFPSDGGHLVSRSRDGIVRSWDTAVRERAKVSRIGSGSSSPASSTLLKTSQGTTCAASIDETNNQNPGYYVQPLWHVSDEWISWGQHKIVRVPVDFRPRTVDCYGGLIAWADRLNRVHSIKLSASMLPSCCAPRHEKQLERTPEMKGVW